VPDNYKILSHDGVTIDGAWIDRIYWTLLTQLVTTLYKLLAKTSVLSLLQSLPAVVR
jgi:hypothetical protein